jgi:rubredoxin
MKKWQCVVCGFIYDEAEGWPDEGIAAGTRWEDVPADWQCPDCGVGKEDFEMIEMGWLQPGQRVSQTGRSAGVDTNNR